MAPPRTAALILLLLLDFALGIQKQSCNMGIRIPSDDSFDGLMCGDFVFEFGDAASISRCGDENPRHTTPADLDAFRQSPL